MKSCRGTTPTARLVGAAAPAVPPVPAPLISIIELWHASCPEILCRLSLIALLSPPPHLITAWDPMLRSFQFMCSNCSAPIRTILKLRNSQLVNREWISSG